MSPTGIISQYRISPQPLSYCEKEWGGRMTLAQAAQRSCKHGMSTWSCFGTRLLHWFLVSTTSLPAGVNPNTGKVHRITIRSMVNVHPMIQGSRCQRSLSLLCTVRLTLAWQHECLCTPPLHGSVRCWSWISVSPPRPPCHFCRTLIVSPFVATTQGQSQNKVTYSLKSKIEQNLTIGLAHCFP